MSPPQALPISRRPPQAACTARTPGPARAHCASITSTSTITCPSTPGSCQYPAVCATVVAQAGSMRCHVENRAKDEHLRPPQAPPSAMDLASRRSLTRSGSVASTSAMTVDSGKTPLVGYPSQVPSCLQPGKHRYQTPQQQRVPQSIMQHQAQALHSNVPQPQLSATPLPIQQTMALSATPVADQQPPPKPFASTSVTMSGAVSTAKSNDKQAEGPSSVVAKAGPLGIQEKSKMLPAWVQDKHKKSMLPTPSLSAVPTVFASAPCPATRGGGPRASSPTPHHERFEAAANCSAGTSGRPSALGPARSPLTQGAGSPRGGLSPLRTRLQCTSFTPLQQNSFVGSIGIIASSSPVATSLAALARGSSLSNAGRPSTGEALGVALEPAVDMTEVPPPLMQGVITSQLSGVGDPHGYAVPASWQPNQVESYGDSVAAAQSEDHRLPACPEEHYAASSSSTAEAYRNADFHLEPNQCITYSQLEFIEDLGSGEFGRVCRGRFRGQDVAIKQLFWDSSMKEEVVLEDLEREVESFRHLKHKNLVTFVGACLEMPTPCLVTEYMPGGSLHHLLHVKQTRLPLLHAINMCMQLADGVRYLHSQDPVVVHRDLKTQNVVLDLNLNVKLCDFGLTESMERTHISKKNNGGSPRYMAPELFDCKTKLTEKVDLWSIGCIFMEIFGGSIPYDGINSLADLTRELLVHKRPPTLPKHLPECLAQIISSCHNFDYRLRPSANQVFDQLKDSKKNLRRLGALPDDSSAKATCRKSQPRCQSSRRSCGGA